MNKDYLDALGTFSYIMTRCKDEDSYIIKFPLGIQEGTTFGEDMQKAYKVIKEALQRLEAIENANPNKALELVGYLKDHHLNAIPYYDWLNDIEKYILKSQEQESENKALLEENKDLYFELALAEKQYKELIECNKQYKNVLEIIKEKDIDISLLKRSENWLDYYTRFKHRTGKNTEITEEEFDTLKRWL